MLGRHQPLSGGRRAPGARRSAAKPSGDPARPRASGPDGLVWSFAGSTQAIALARNTVADEVGRRHPELADDIRLLVSELATNAVQHAHTAFEVAAMFGPRRVRLEVRDHSPQLPVPRSPELEATSGRGYCIVDALTADWGVRRRPGGKAVWVELDVAHDPPRPPS
jgi:anti-sigma regulatory factor (Ser/Thr protein kinase)